MWVMMSYSFFFSVLGIGLRVLFMLVKCSITELYPQFFSFWDKVLLSHLG